MAAAMDTSTDATNLPTKITPKARVDQFTGLTTGATVEVPHCGCDVRPWEDCVHTAKPTVA